ncbi:MAG: universal stress protein [Desulfitobacteriaceae bacterium]|nr:universal stress protein [Desulfitobacteriaceae bacterium]MDD4346526.1 universal stress protein [Desulfitobacteriaceae bacterium]
MFKNILVPVDGSEDSLNAAKAAVTIREKFGGKMTLLHVIAKRPEADPDKDKREISIKKIETLRAEGYKVLEKAIQSLGKDSVEIEAVLSWGNPADIILEEAEDKGYDLIVMGSRGLGAIRGMLLGSVSEKVSKSIKCPVMMVKEL